MQIRKSIIVSIAAMGLASSVAAKDITIADNSLHVKSNQYSDQLKMTVTGPDGFSFVSSRFGGDNIISAAEMQATKDGLYKVEFLDIKELGEEQVQDDFNGRGLATRKIVDAKRVSGQFRIKNGVMINSQLLEQQEAGSKKTLSKD